MGWIDSLIGKALSHASARAHGDSTRARELLAQIASKPLAVRISGTPWDAQPLVFESDGTALALLSSEAAAQADIAATLTGAPLSLTALLSDAEGVIRRGDVRIDGDAQLAQRYRELALLMAPDLEQSLSGVLGRSAAHLIMAAARKAMDTARNAADTSLRNVAEYFSHERGDLVSRPEAEDFFRTVEQAREQLDRLEARLTHLAVRLGDLTEGPGPL